MKYFICKANFDGCLCPTNCLEEFAYAVGRVFICLLKTNGLDFLRLSRTRCLISYQEKIERGFVSSRSLCHREVYIT